MGGRVVGRELNHLSQYLLRLSVLLPFQVNLTDLIEGGRVLRVLQQNFPEGLQGEFQAVLVLVDEAHGKQGGGLPVIQAQGLLQELFRLVQLLQVEVSQAAVDNGRQEILADGQASGKFLPGLFVVELLQQGDADIVVVDQAGFSRSAFDGRFLHRGPEGAGLPQGLAGSRTQGQDQQQDQVDAPVRRKSSQLGHTECSLRHLQNSTAGPLPGMATKGTKTQKERNDIKKSFCDFCAFCGEPAFLTRSHPILRKAEHHVCRQNDLPRCDFCKKLDCGFGFKSTSVAMAPNRQSEINNQQFSS